MPNSPLPLVIFKRRLAREDCGGEAVCDLYVRNGWTGTWVYTVYPFWHFHTLGHEVLACVGGSATIGFGGDEGIRAEVEIGDVCIVPAGVGHRRLVATDSFLMAGGYPPTQIGDIVRPGEMDVAQAMAAIGKLALPTTDPISGDKAQGLVALWRE